MIAWIDADPETRRTEADRFIRRNTGSPLEADAQARAVADVLRTNPQAWKAWLTDGSREDWNRRIRVLRAHPRPQRLGGCRSSASRPRRP